MRSPIHIARVAAALAVGGAVSGALSGAFVIEAAVVVLLRAFAPLSWLGVSSIIGAGLGAVVAPGLAWGLLRHVPIGRAMASIATGIGIGGAIGVVLGVSAVNPYVPLAVNRAPVPQGFVGALIGAALAAIVVRALSRCSRTPERAG
jgi:hypothetical protein